MPDNDRVVKLICFCSCFFRGSDRERDHDYRGTGDRDRTGHRDSESSAAHQHRHDKDPPIRDRDDRNRDHGHPSAKRGRYTDENSAGGGGESTRGSSWRDRDLNDRDVRKDELHKKVSDAGAAVEKARDPGGEHVCHTSRVSEVRDVIRIVADGAGPSSGDAVRVAESLANLSAGEALGAIGMVIDTLVDSTEPADAEVIARWLEALSCFCGDAAASAWERYLQHDTGGPSK